MRAFLVAFSLLTSVATAQFQTNHDRAHLEIDGHGGTADAPMVVARSIGQSATVSFDAGAHLQGQPMAVLVSGAPLVPSGMTLPGGQMLNLDLASSIAIPSIWDGPFESPVQFDSPGSLATQLIVLDPTAPDGLSVSAPGQIVFEESTIVATRPQVIGVSPGRVVQHGSSGETPLSEGGVTSTGLVFDDAGNLWFGRALHAGGFHVELFRRDPTGQETSFGIVVDTRGGFVMFGAHGFDLEWANGQVVFTHPSVSGGSNAQAGSVRALDPDTGAVTELVGSLANPTGLAVDANGDLFFGVSIGTPARFDLFRRDASGVVSMLGTAFDTAGSFYAIGIWAFDLAVRGNTLVYNVPALSGGSGGGQSGRIIARDLDSGATTVLADGFAQPSGLAFDENGGLFFSNVQYGPSRAHLHYWNPATTTTEDRGLLFTCSDGLVPIGPYGIDLVTP